MKLTHHAALRWSERTGLSRALLRIAMARAIDVPRRYIGHVTAKKWGGRRDAAARRVRYRVTASAVLVVKRDHVVTCVALPDDALASVLVWLMTGCWA